MARGGRPSEMGGGFLFFVDDRRLRKWLIVKDLRQIRPANFVLSLVVVRTYVNFVTVSRKFPIDKGLRMTI